MEYHKYFELFLSIEERLAGYMRQLEFTRKTETLYSSEISLLLLQTCPVIESYMSQLCTQSNQVINNPIYDWEWAAKLWDSDKKGIKEKGGFRSISTFPKFSYVVEKVFDISQAECRFYYSERFQVLDGNEHFKAVKPFETLRKFVDFMGFEVQKNKRFPQGLDTPTWWTAYNKVKHDMDEAEKRVTYRTAIEALGGLFVLLAYCDADYELLKNNGYVSGHEVRSKLFSAPVPKTQWGRL